MGDRVQMEKLRKLTKRKNPGQKRLHAIFFRFLLLYALLAVGAGVIIFFSYFVLVSLGMIRIPSYEQTRIMQAADAIRTGGQVEEKLLPDTCVYGVYGEDGTWLYGNIPAEQRKEVWRQAGTQETTSMYGSFWQRIEKENGSTAMIRYQVMAKFVSPALREIFPNAELVFLGAFVLIIVILTVCMPRRFGRYVDRRLKVLSETAARVEREDLAFEREHSDIKEIDEVLASLHKMKEALQKSLREQWELEQKKEQQVRALAHDIRTPLTIIRGNAELLAETEDLREIREWDGEILDNIKDIEGYLVILQETMKGEISLEDGCGQAYFPARPWLEEIKEKAAALGRAGKAEILCRLELPEASSCFLEGNRTNVSRAVLNVISNGVDYTPADGKVEIHASIVRPGDDGREWLRITVTDQGPGFSGEDLKRGTERFYQGDGSRGHRHYGMGLYIARTFTEEAGGRLTLSNAETGGAQVRIDLPLYQGAFLKD